MLEETLAGIVNLEPVPSNPWPGARTPEITCHPGAKNDVVYTIDG